ncbi:MAG: hypothetical protein M1819_003729 [Sarea resinae]|nr:MAG: hypothetical protein M1819_003729 [Sarea resinae]
MDYSYFTAPPQPYQFIGLPPTPAHTHPLHPEEYSNGSSPLNDHYNQAFQNYEQYKQFENDRVVGHTPPESNPNPPASLNNGDSGISVDFDQEQARRSSSEEKESMTPAQSRRKAQNRAAQRAFRERKERHVKELEQKLSSLEQASNSLHADNERLKRELQKVATENEILRATSSHHNGSSSNYLGHHESSPSVVGPMSYSPVDFYTNMRQESHPDRGPSHRITVSEKTGERLLAAGATWDLIQDHALFKRGLVDIGNVCERLKKVAQCDGQGPVFEECDIQEAIEGSAASGNDELI